MAITIGELSRKTHVKVPTIRYYERSGLLSPPTRSEKSRRQYEPDVVARLKFIKHTRNLGFETDEIKAMLEMTTNGASEEIDIMVGFIAERVTKLEALKTELASLSEDIRNGLLNEEQVLNRLSQLTFQHENDQHVIEEVESNPAVESTDSAHRPRRSRSKNL